MKQLVISYTKYKQVWFLINQMAARSSSCSPLLAGGIPRISEPNYLYLTPLLGPLFRVSAQSGTRANWSRFLALVGLSLMVLP